MCYKALVALNKQWQKVLCQVEVATQCDCLLKTHGFCTDYSVPISLCPLRGLSFLVDVTP